ncbi:MAG: pyridoxamine 5'-phosphate oxidase family protein [Armatimonadetes bacterium]|nr:pyridoxamine 5'-phosphate oxidase family protein [Armatimonadota bacterium]
MEKYHAGEIAVQERAQVREMSGRVANGIRDFVVPAAADFLQTQAFVVASIADEGGNIWAVPVRGPLDMGTDNRHVRIATNLSGAVGFAIMDFAHRKRMRVNGVAEAGILAVGECYANCPQYLQKRSGNENADGVFAPVPVPVSQDETLTDAQTAMIRAADTFFIATRNGEISADASHRGGNPGFVQVADHRTVTWRDYSGNTMFNTLGNLQADSRAALFFPDFATGDALLLSGTARVQWESPDDRTVVFAVERVAVLLAAFDPLDAAPVEYSPFNPPP